MTLDNIFSIQLQQKYNNNILIVGRDDSMAVHIILSLLKSAILISDSRIIIFAEPTDEKYQMLKKLWGDVIDFKKIEVYDNYSEICSIINGLNSLVKKKTPLFNKNFIFWFGLNDLYEEFCVSPTKKDFEGENKLNSDRIFIDEKEIMKNPAIIEKSESLGLSLSEVLSFITEKEDQDMLGKTECYNATEDMLELFALGSKFGIFNMVLFENIQSARRVRNLDLNNFIHKIALSMSREESFEWGLQSSASEIEENIMAIYSNGITRSIFKPYMF